MRLYTNFRAFANKFKRTHATKISSAKIKLDWDATSVSTWPADDSEYDTDRQSHLDDAAFFYFH